MGLVPIVKTTSAQQVARQLLDSIRNGAWNSGDQLPTEKELIERLSVGRSTVREALQILATLNIVHAIPGQGTFIKNPSPSEVFRPDLIGFLINNAMALELLEAREMIEPSMARLACLRGTENDFNQIERVLEEHQADHAAGRPVSEHAAKFHMLLGEASHNRVLVMFMRSIYDLLLARGRRIDHIPDYQLQELKEHRKILNLVRARKPNQAADCVLQHIVRSAATYDANYESWREDLTSKSSERSAAGIQRSSPSGNDPGTRKRRTRR